LPRPATSRLLRQIKEVCELAGTKTEEYAKVSKKKLDVMSLGREVSKEKTALGERIYDLSRKGELGTVSDDTTVQAILTRLGNLDGSLEACEEEITSIRDSARERVVDVRRKYEPPKDEGSDADVPDDGAPGAEARGDKVSGAESSRAGIPEIESSGTQASDDEAR
jgi:hypothetical protein